jgi:maleylacetate reductase
VIDTAKAVALVLAQPVETRHSYVAVRVSSFAARPTMPIIALPTTLSGSEFTANVATTDEELVKHVMADPRIAPASVLLDPELTATTPSRLWRSTGIKTLSDAIEQISYGAGPVTDALCARSIEFFANSLAAPPEDSNRRLQAQQAAWMSLFGLQDSGGSVGLGAALRHQVAVTFGAHHGEATCVLLPHVIRFNAPDVADRAAPVAAALGIPIGSDGVGLWNAVADKLRDLIVDLGLPTRLSEICAREASLDDLADRVAAEAVVQRNPRPIRSSAEIVNIINDAW